MRGEEGMSTVTLHWFGNGEEVDVNLDTIISRYGRGAGKTELYDVAGDRMHVKETLAEIRELARMARAQEDEPWLVLTLGENEVVIPARNVYPRPQTPPPSKPFQGYTECRGWHRKAEPDEPQVQWPVYPLPLDTGPCPPMPPFPYPLSDNALSESEDGVTF
jgi:hypothetical protein